MADSRIIIHHQDHDEPVFIKPPFGLGDFIAMERATGIGSEEYDRLSNPPEGEKPPDVDQLIYATLFLSYIAARRLGVIEGGPTLDPDVLRPGFDAWGAGVLNFDAEGAEDAAEGEDPQGPPSEDEEATAPAA